MSNLAQIKSGVFSMNVYIINCQEHMSNVAQIASPGSGVFSMKVYKVCKCPGCKTLVFERLVF